MFFNHLPGFLFRKKAHIKNDRHHSTLAIKNILPYCTIMAQMNETNIFFKNFGMT